MNKRIQDYKVQKRRRTALGQHFLTDENAKKLLIEAAQIGKNDTVFEIGTGNGEITSLLSKEASQVITVEIDPRKASGFMRQLNKNNSNITLLCADAFRIKPIPMFDHCVTSLPFSRSRDFIEWLAKIPFCFKNAAAILQSDFVSKITAAPGTKNYRAISVICQLSFIIERIYRIPRFCFVPPPRVESEIVKLNPNPEFFPFFTESRIMNLKKIFAFRGRLLRSAVNKNWRAVAGENSLSETLLNQRIENLAPAEYAKILKVL
jgi:16S rRNA A1518/A1519 N6-dimethyltransferase RsmA/KsgA/DIM1 with predicted DNA glycosylase/AP lyase activity